VLHQLLPIGLSIQRVSRIYTRISNIVLDIIATQSKAMTFDRAFSKYLNRFFYFKQPPPRQGLVFPHRNEPSPYLQLSLKFSHPYQQRNELGSTRLLTSSSRILPVKALLEARHRAEEQRAPTAEQQQQQSLLDAIAVIIGALAPVGLQFAREWRLLASKLRREHRPRYARQQFVRWHFH